MRVAIVAGPNIPVPPRQYGGTEQVIYHLIQGLVEAGHEPILLGAGDSEVNCQVIPIVEKALFYPLLKKDLKKHQELENKALRRIHKELRAILPEIDIIHSHGFDLSRYTRFPNVTTIHNMIDFEHIEYYRRRRQLNYVSISDNQQATFPDLNYVATVYNGENPREFPIVEEPEDYVCFLGRFDTDKNPHMAIQLALSMGVKIKLAGKIDFKGEAYFKDEIEKYLSHPLVEYLGELGFEEKVELLSRAKCNLHPTNFREPFGLTVLEAAYCGTPTLATNRGSMPELIEVSRTGVLVEDFVEGTQHLKECFEMDRKYIASRSRQLFNYSTMTEQYLQSYQKVIAAMPPRRNDVGIWQKVRHAFQAKMVVKS